MTRSPAIRVSCQYAALFFLMTLAACSGGGGGAPVPAPASPAPPVTATPPATATPVPAATATPVSHATTTPSPAATASAAATSGPQSGTKAPIEGLLSMGSDAFTNQASAVPDNGMEEINAHPGVYKGAVINATWAQLEPQQGVFDDSAIASALSTIAAYNAKYSATPVQAKLRVFAGDHTPAWVFPIAGGPISVDDNGTTIQIPAFWTPAYDTLWKALQDHLAASFDAGSQIAETTVGSCSSLTAEPFITPLNATSLPAMRAYGFSDSTDKACLSNAMNDYTSWKSTPLDFPFNVYRDSDGNSLVDDPDFTMQVLTAFRTALGGRAIVANHGLQSPLSTGAQQLDAALASLGPPIEFQGYSPQIDWDASVALGVGYKASEIEIWQTQAAGGPANISLMQLQQYAAELP